MIEKHITQVNNALTLLHRNVDLLLDSVLHAQAGKVQPQLVPPKLLLESLRESQASFPQETILPFALRADSASLVYKVCDVQVYIQSGKLSYIVSIPLTDKGEGILFSTNTNSNKQGQAKFTSGWKSLFCAWIRQDIISLALIRNYRVARKLLY